MAPVLLLAGVAGLGYYGYSKGWFSSLTGSTTTTTPPTGTTTPPNTNFNSLANIYARLVADITKNEAAKANAMMSLYQWNWYLARSWSGTPPDATAFADPNFDPAAPMSLNAYWSAANPWLAKNAGLSGVWSV